MLLPNMDSGISKSLFNYPVIENLLAKNYSQLNFKIMRKIFLSALSLILIFNLFVACNNADNDTQPAFDLAAARKQIDSANIDFMKLVSKGDSVALANYYTTDAKLMEPNQPAIVGRKNIQTAIAGLVNAGIQLDLTTLDVWGDESMLAEEVELFPAAMIGNLPPLHFLARMSGGRIIKGRLPILKAE